MTDTKPNAELAYRVLDQIDAHPELWRQDWWLTKADCGTAACFAGWACILSGDTPRLVEPDDFEDQVEFSYVTSPGDAPIHVNERATELLGIAPNQSRVLFDGLNNRRHLGEYVERFFGPRPGGAA